jgi:hypothetical protein
MKDNVKVGVPRKKRYFDINSDSQGGGSCFINSNVLYVHYCFYNLETDAKSTSIKKFNLDIFSGNENDGEELYFDKEDSVPFVCDYGDYILLVDDKNKVFDKKSLNVILSESKEQFSSGYGVSFNCFIIDNGFYRQLDREKPELGYDVIDLPSKIVVKHLDVNLEWPKNIDGRFIVGLNTANKVEIFSIDENKAMCQLDGRQYFDHDADLEPGRIKYALSDSRLAIGYRGVVLIVNLENFSVLQTIDCFKFDEFLAVYEEENGLPNIPSSYIEGLVFFENTLLIHGGPRLSFLMSINLHDPENLNWVLATYYLDAIRYVGGDLIFGIDGGRPVAWDFYTGEKIWEASAGTIGNKIQIGDGWVVVDANAGYIQCFKWKKPFISPHRPVESN